ncbi:hypothetical protein ACSBR2_037391 [Camellia fascicularis]
MVHILLNCHKTSVDLEHYKFPVSNVSSAHHFLLIIPSKTKPTTAKKHFKQENGRNCDAPSTSKLCTLPLGRGQFAERSSRRDGRH